MENVFDTAWCKDSNDTTYIIIDPGAQDDCV